MENTDIIEAIILIFLARFDKILSEIDDNEEECVTIIQLTRKMNHY